MGINYQGASSATSIVRVPAVSTVAAGDLLLNTQGGAVKASEVLTLAQLNNTTAGLSVIYPRTTASSANYGEATQSNLNTAVCEMSNGEVWHGYTGNGTTTSYGVNIDRLNVIGSVAAPTISVTTGTACSGVWLSRLVSGSVVVAWTEAAILYFAIYSSSGTQTVGRTSAATIGSGSHSYWCLATLADGGFVLAYAKTAGNNSCFKRYDASGALQGSEVVVEAANTNEVVVKPLLSGGFIVSHQNGEVPVRKFARYTSSGVLDGTLTALPSGTGAFSYGHRGYLVTQLPNGNLVFQVWLSPNNYLHVYTSTGTLITSHTLAGSTTESTAGFAAPVVILPSGGFALITIGTVAANIYYRTFDSSGNPLQSITAIAATAGTGDTPSGALLLAEPVSGGVVIFVMSYNYGTNYYRTGMAVVDNAGVLQGSLVELLSISANTSQCQQMLLHSSGLALVCYRNSSDSKLYRAVYSPAKSSVLGVALDSASPGATCRVATSGTWQINQSMQGGAFDQRTATVPGTRGFIIGSTAVLLGLN